MATHSSIFAWEISRTEKPGGLQSMGSQRVRHDRKWKRKWQSTPVFLPGKSYGQRSLVGYGPQGHKELDTTEAT